MPIEDAFLDGLAGASFTVAGTVALLRRPGNRIGPLMLAVGFTWFFGNFAGVSDKVTIEATCPPDGRLNVTVADDGEGGATIELGGGLAGLRDRVEALGGQLVVVSSPDRGTIVHAAIPCE